MATVNRNQWEESEDWRALVSPANQQKFLEALAESKREGREVKSVLVIGGTPLVYNVSD